jgi:hypothetical protein
MEPSVYYDYILGEDASIVREIQSYCADLEEAQQQGIPGHAWNKANAEHVASLFNRSENPVALFRFVDERTGSHYVGYRTRDGREWFHILRQMRNTRESGLLENLGR